MKNPLHAKDDPRILKFFDCIHYSIQILESQYRDLKEIVSGLKPSDSTEIVRALAIIWSIVDSLNRVREVAQSLPGMNKKASEVKLFLDSTGVVAEFRNYIQHLRNELTKKNLGGFPVWGTFSWVNNDDTTTCYTAFTGTTAGNLSGGSCVYDTHERRWVSTATLTIKDYILHVDPCYESARRFCHFAIEWIKNIKDGQIEEPKDIPVFSAQFQFPDIHVS